jgi:hypothetical protein
LDLTASDKKTYEPCGSKEEAVKKVVQDFRYLHQGFHLSGFFQISARLTARR